jgi:hypothetical protein
MVKTRIFSALIVVVLSAVFGWRVSLAQIEDDGYVKETGHYLNGEFRDKYLSTESALLVYGYPITDAFWNQKEGKYIQYFQKARFELRSDDTTGQRVRLTPLGKYALGKSTGVPAALPDNSPTCRSFAETEYQVCYAFLEFFDANGGLEQFGLPISGIVSENEWLVQYFEYARLVWYPGLDAQQRITISDLGSQYFNEREDTTLAEPPKDDHRIEGVLRIKSRAYPMKAVTKKDDLQTIYILVQDQRLLPVESAEVTVNIYLPDGKPIKRIAPMITDENGITQVSFPMSAAEVGVARVEVFASYNGMPTETSTSFRVWW